MGGLQAQEAARWQVRGNRQSRKRRARPGHVADANQYVGAGHQVDDVDDGGAAQHARPLWRADVAKYAGQSPRQRDDDQENGQKGGHAQAHHGKIGFVEFSLRKVERCPLRAEFKMAVLVTLHRAVHQGPCEIDGKIRAKKLHEQIAGREDGGNHGWHQEHQQWRQVRGVSGASRAAEIEAQAAVARVAKPETQGAAHHDRQ
jgi:hypothetical protein